MKPRRALVVLAVAAVSLLAACGSAAPYAAKVNGERISQREVNRELDAILDNRPYLERLQQGFEQQQPPLRVPGEGKGTFDTIFVARLLDRRILVSLVHQEVARRNLPLDLRAARADVETSFADDPEASRRMFRAFPAAYRDELVRTAAEVQALEAALTKPVSDADVKSFYDQNPALFSQACVRHILVDNADKANQIKARIAAGEDFAAIARAESKDTATAANGGDLGCVPESALPPEGRVAVTEAQPGQVIGPIRTDRGFYVIQVQSTTTQPIEAVAGQIRQFLESQSGNAISEFLEKALAEAEIEVNPRYGRFERAGERPAVVPPDLPATSTTTPAEEVPIQ